MRIIKKWWFSILMWIITCLVFTVLFWWLNTDEELYIIGSCLCSYVILGIIFMLIGLANAPVKEEKKYKVYKDFLEWYEKNKENKL